jgi:hypothetical protein
VRGGIAGLPLDDMAYTITINLELSGNLDNFVTIAV